MMSRKVARFFMSVALCAPLVFSSSLFFPFISGKAIFFRLAIELALFFFLISVLRGVDLRAQGRLIWSRLKNPLCLSVIAFGCMAVITALAGVYPASSVWSNFQRGEGAFQILHYVIFFLLLVLLFENRRSFERLLKVHVLVSSLVCLYAAFQFSNPFDFRIISESLRVSGTLGNPSYLAGYLLISSVFLVYFFSRARTIVSVSFWGALMCAQLYMFLLTQTRAAFLALSIGCFLVLVMNGFFAQSRRKRFLCFGGALLGVAFASVFIATHSSPLWRNIPMLSRTTDVTTTFNELEPRLWTWQSAMSGFFERPILGWGVENFTPVFEKYYNPHHYGIESFFDRTHNVFLEYAIAGGLVLLLSWLAIFFFYYKQLFRRPKDFWFTIFFGMPIAYLIQGFFLFDVLPIYIVFFLCMAFFIQRGNPEWKKSPIRESGSRRSGKSWLIYLVLLCALVFVSYKTALVPFRKNLLLAQALQTSRASAAFPAYIEALEYRSVIGQVETVDALGKFVLNLFETVHKKGDPETFPISQVRILVDAHNTWFDETFPALPSDGSVYINGAVNIEAGLTFGQDDYVERGKTLYEAVLARNPTRIEFVKVLLRLAKAQDDQDAYERYRVMAITLRPDLEWE